MKEMNKDQETSNMKDPRADSRGVGHSVPGVRRVSGLVPKRFSSTAVVVAAIGGGGAILSPVLRMLGWVEPGSARAIQWIGVILALGAVLYMGFRRFR